MLNRKAPLLSSAKIVLICFAELVTKISMPLTGSGVVFSWKRQVIS
jgi:hypothetical protein